MRIVCSNFQQLNAFFKCTPNQKKIKRAISNPKPLTVIEGPAGSGKTMITLEASMKLVDEEAYESLIVTRPMVGVMQEQIGYLPGTLEEKSAPWTDVIHAYAYRPFTFIPLTFMRGHTWDNSIILADEMQNSTPEQMKTLLTRVGRNTKLIINGDNSQSDIGIPNGLSDLRSRLTTTEDEYFDVIQLTSDDIKRSPFVKFIHELYEDENHLRESGVDLR